MHATAIRLLKQAQSEDVRDYCISCTQAGLDATRDELNRHFDVHRSVLCSKRESCILEIKSLCELKEHHDEQLHPKYKSIGKPVFGLFSSLHKNK